MLPIFGYISAPLLVEKKRRIFRDSDNLTTS